MLERSELAGNALLSLHDEEYGRQYNPQNLNADTLFLPLADPAYRWLANGISVRSS